MSQDNQRKFRLTTITSLPGYMDSAVFGKNHLRRSVFRIRRIIHELGGLVGGDSDG